MRQTKGPRENRGEHASLRTVADYLGLSPATISLVLNCSPIADTIPEETQKRVRAAARRLNYRPNFMARSLRKQRTLTVGIMVPEISQGYAALVLAGIEAHLLREGYLYFVASHHHRPDLIRRYPRLLFERSVEGLIAVDTPYADDIPVPVVAVSGTGNGRNVTRIVLDHRRAAELSLDHLVALGHQRIAIIKGQEFSSDTHVRWQAIVAAARARGIVIPPKLVAQLEGDSPSPQTGYDATKRLLAHGEWFTALFAFNDVSAIGAICALRGAGMRIPEDISVIGFDDIESAAFQNPGLTTVRQPLEKMGEIAARTVLQRISGKEPTARIITVEPELVVRGTTAPAPSRLMRGR